MRILVVGDSMLDRYWYGEASRLSPEAPVPVVHVEREEWRLGAAANVAHNCATLGAEVRLCTAFGADEAGKRLSSMLWEAGIGVDLNESRTTVKLRVIGMGQQIVRADFETPCLGVVPRSDDIDWCDVVVISDYGKGCIREPRRIIGLCGGKPVFVDTKADYLGFRGCSLLKQNVPEFQGSVGKWDCEGDLELKAYSLRGEIGGDVLLTRGRDGMTLFGEKRVDIASTAKEVFDVTGAGDTVMAALAVFTAEGKPLEDACRIANKAGGIVVGKFGTATVTRAELD